MCKKIFIVILAVAFSTESHAQLKVDTVGNIKLANRQFTTGVKVKIAETPSHSSGTKQNIFSCINTLDETMNLGKSGSVGPSSQTIINPNAYAVGLLGYARRASGGKNFGVIGNISDGYGAGIYGTIGIEAGFQLQGSYAGFFNGQTRVIGNLYASNFLTASDIRLKENIEPVDDGRNGSSTLQNIMNLNVIRYNYKCSEPKEPQMEGLDEETAAQYGIQAVNEEERKMLDMLHEQKHYGLSAQELQKVYPELVSEGQDGYLSVNYVELVPLLLRCIQEMQQEIEELQGSTDGQRKVQRNEMATGTSPAKATANMLFQNRPNPFKEQTEIGFSLADGVKDASICIFDMQGKMLMSYPAQSGMKSVTVNGYELGAGMFLYSLVVNGQEVDTKKMILSK